MKKPFAVQPVTYPNIAYGNTEFPKAQTLVVQKCNGLGPERKEGILEQTDVLVKNGKIAAVGKKLSDGGATIIDAKGKRWAPAVSLTNTLRLLFRMV